MLVCWSDVEEGKDETLKPTARVMEGIPGILEDVLHTAGQRSLKKKLSTHTFT